jgi:putative membrane protein
MSQKNLVKVQSILVLTISVVFLTTVSVSVAHSLGVTPMAYAQKTGAANLNTRDRNFVMEAAMGGMAEVELGKLATQKATSDAVKQFGQKMVDDHSAANSELTQLAAAKGITLPTELDAKHRADITRLSKLSGAAFDGAYSKAMLDDHVKDVAAFEKESTSGTDPEVKAFATKTLPTLKQHLEMARSLNGQSSKTNPATKPGN